VNPRDSIDVRDDTGKAIGCHYELNDAKVIRKMWWVISAASRPRGRSRAVFCVAPMALF